MDIRWEEQEDGKRYELYFAPYYDEESVAVVERDCDGDYALVYGDFGLDSDYLAPRDTPLWMVKEMVENIMKEYYQDQVSYYLTTLNKFKKSVLERRAAEAVPVRERLRFCTENNLDIYHLRGFQITESDYDKMEKLVKDGMLVEAAVGEVLADIQECIGAGLEEEPEEER